ncbi:glycosyl hydrolase [Streptomyces sp. GESEQ-35]|uniref:glycosyl hydrolase n=1 Tax=Streptomyces sp. GESEQ-35 TaxID=2812657 RepID=UPI001B3191DE|nr:glycosyl hydrolase [Streptomyces sp. GESEQ-35]
MNSELTRLFDEPSPEFSPAPLWWWSGEKVTPERLTEQLEQLAGQGVKNVVVINLAPAGPMVGAASDDPLWFSEEWWDRFADACEICERLGMRIWFYDQIGFSGANLQGRLTQDHPEYAGATLHRTELKVSADGRVAVPPLATPVAAYDADGRRIALGDDGRLVDGEATPETPVTLTYTLRTAYDYLSPEACDALRDLVHGEFERRMPERLGRVIAGSFQDELPMHNSWTPRLSEEFTKRRGYDLLDVLPALWAPEATEDGAKVLGDYYRTRAELAEEAFFRPLGEWHSRYGMLVGADQLNPARGGQPIQATQFYSDYFRTHRWFGAAGSDHEGDIKVHSSMAHLYGHDRVWCESFHSSGWGGTLEDTYDWLLPFFQSGATLYNPHAVYYSMRGGWFEWAPPSTDWRQPYWGAVRTVRPGRLTDLLDAQLGHAGVRRRRAAPGGHGPGPASAGRPGRPQLRRRRPRPGVRSPLPTPDPVPGVGRPEQLVPPPPRCAARGRGRVRHRRRGLASAGRPRGRVDRNRRAVLPVGRTARLRGTGDRDRPLSARTPGRRRPGGAARRTALGSRGTLRRRRAGPADRRTPAGPDHRQPRRTSPSADRRDPAAALLRPGAGPREGLGGCGLRPGRLPERLPLPPA